MYDLSFDLCTFYHFFVWPSFKAVDILKLWGRFYVVSNTPFFFQQRDKLSLELYMDHTFLWFIPGLDPHTGQIYEAREPEERYPLVYASMEDSSRPIPPCFFTRNPTLYLDMSLRVKTFQQESYLWSCQGNSTILKYKSVEFCTPKWKLHLECLYCFRLRPLSRPHRRLYTVDNSIY